MDLTADLNEALARRQTREKIAELLRKLSPADRRAVLLDLIAADHELPVTEPNTAERSAAVPTRASRGRPRRRKNGKRVLGRTETLIEVLQEHPGMPIREIAVKVYGSDSKRDQHQVRALLTALKGRKRVTNTSPGKWELVK